MISSQAFDLKLLRRVQNPKVVEIDQIKLGGDRVYSTFRKQDRPLRNHPILESKISPSSLAFESRRTVHILLSDQLADAYLKDEKLFYGTERLYTITERREKEKTLAKRLRDLKFDLKKINIHYFISEFKELMEETDQTVAKTHLKAKIPVSFHRQLSQTFVKQISEIYDDLVKFFDGRFDSERNRLNSLKLTDSSVKSVEHFVEAKFEYFERFTEGVTMRERINFILGHFPSNVITEFVSHAGKFNVPSAYLTQKEPFLAYLHFVCKQHHDHLGGLAITKADALRDKFTARPNSSDSRNYSTSTAVNDSVMLEIEQCDETEIQAYESADPVAEFPDKLNFSLFEEILNADEP